MYGDGPISAFRIMFFNKPAGKGTHLPWHQDRWQHLDRDPLLTMYTALDPSSPENGCVQVIPGSHKKGVINKEHHSGFLTEKQAEEHCLAADIVNLELEAGQVALLHNWTLHRSGVNNSKTGLARRAFSVNYTDGKTQIAHMDKLQQGLGASQSTGYAHGGDYLAAVFPALENHLSSRVRGGRVMQVLHGHEWFCRSVASAESFWMQVMLVLFGWRRLPAASYVL